MLGLDEVYAQQSPADKVAAVRGERDRAVTVMVGDGVNDAPALAAATVGVAMGARGATASSEAADIVLTTDRLDRLADAMDIARWSRRIAVQSAVVGMTLSLVAMVIAALGWLPPAAGALLQEGIDVAVILNALRALRGNPSVEVELLGRHREDVAPLRGRTRRDARHHRAAARRRRPSGRRCRSDGLGVIDACARLPDRADPAPRTCRGDTALPGTGPPARQRRSHGHHEQDPCRDPAIVRSDRHTSERSLRRATEYSPTRSTTCSHVCMGSTRCCGCISCRRRRTTSRSPRTKQRTRRNTATITTRRAGISSKARKTAPVTISDRTGT